MGTSSLNSGNTEITDNKAKAEIISNQFKAVFTVEDVDTIPDMDSNGVSDIDPLEFQTKGIASLLRNINTKKASGPDGSCQNSVFDDQYSLTVSRAQVSTH